MVSFAVSEEDEKEHALTEEEISLRTKVFERKRRSPFLHNLGLVKLYTFGMILVPLRVCLMLFFHMLTLPLLVLALRPQSGSTEGKFTGWRRTALHIIFYIWVRGQLFLFGCFYIHTKGKRPSPTGKLLNGKNFVLIGNHCGWTEVAFMAMDYLPSFVAKSGIKKWPVIGPITLATGAVYVDRLMVHAAAAGESTTELISDKVNNVEGGGQACVAMYPEGTTTNGTSIIHLRHGAFVPGVTVVPVILYLGFHICFIVRHVVHIRF